MCIHEHTAECLSYRHLQPININQTSQKTWLLSKNKIWTLLFVDPNVPSVKIICYERTVLSGDI